MKTRIVTAVLFTLAILAFVIPGFHVPWLPIVLFFLVALGASLELHQALLHKVRPLKFRNMASSAFLLLAPCFIWYAYRDLRPAWHFIKKTALPLDAAWKTDMVWLLSLSVALTASLVLFFIFINVFSNILKRGPETIVHGAAESSSLIYLTLPLSMVPMFMFAVPNGYKWLLVAVFIPWISDVFAYFTGVTWGKTKILPRVSPNKSFEGFLGGIAGSMLVCSLYFLIFMGGAEPMRSSKLENFLYGLAFGLILSLVSQFGDWLASALKRWVRIKDFSHLLPGHGGILDRFDSVIMTLPAAMICAVFYYLF